MTRRVHHGLGARRHTMGNDWGGRRAENPAGARRVSGKEVLACAQASGVEVRREGQGWSMWWYRRSGEPWRSLGTTNYRALEQLGRLSSVRNLGAALPESRTSQKGEPVWAT
jgi:hypothetical protein